MDNYFNFKLTSDAGLTRQCIEKNIFNFPEACQLIRDLPYGRNTDRGNYTLVLKEHKGTCSTKHAFLKQLAAENGFDKIILCIGIYKMDAVNTLGIGDILTQYQINYIPEAHTYLKYDNNISDFTSANASLKFKDSLMYEQVIDAYQIGEFKLKLHHQFLKSWIEENDITYSFQDLWKIREACIKALSK